MRRFLLPIAIIAAGLMLGIIFSTSFSGRNNADTAGIPSGQNANTQPSAVLEPYEDSLQTSTKIFPKEIKVVESGTDIAKDFSKIEKATISLNYLNYTTQDLSGVQIAFTTSPNSNIGIAPVTNAVLDSEASKSQKRQIFNLPDVKKGESKSATFSVHGLNKGTHTIYGQMKTKEGVSATTIPFAITVR